MQSAKECSVVKPRAHERKTTNYKHMWTQSGMKGDRLDIRCGGILWTRGKVNASSNVIPKSHYRAQAQQQKAATGEIDGL